MTMIECMWDAKATLGEGVRHDAERGEVWWVDILGQKIFRLTLDTGEKQVWDTPETVGCTLPDGRGGVLALFRHSLVRLDVATGTFSKVLDFADEPANNRFNDGCVGPDGSLWLGSMDYDFTVPTGRLYRVGADGRASVADEGYTVVNGPAISADGRTLYVNETMAGTVFAFDHDPVSGAISGKRLFVALAKGEGLPDGICVDRAGGLWVALVTGGAIRRYLPDGTIDRHIAMPSPIVTSVCQSADDDDTFFVTTGRILMDDSALAAHPLSGGLFRVRL